MPFCLFICLISTMHISQTLHIFVVLLFVQTLVIVCFYLCLCTSKCVFELLFVAAWHYASLAHHVEKPNLCWQALLQTSCCRWQKTSELSFIPPPHLPSLHPFICPAGGRPRALSLTRAALRAVHFYIPEWWKPCVFLVPLSGDSHLHLNVRPCEFVWNMHVFCETNDLHTVALLCLFHSTVPLGLHARRREALSRGVANHTSV